MADKLKEEWDAYLSKKRPVYTCHTCGILYKEYSHYEMCGCCGGSGVIELDECFQCKGGGEITIKHTDICKNCLSDWNELNNN